MTTVVYPLCAGFAFLALLYRIRRVVTNRSLANVALCGIFTFIVLSWTLVTPWLWTPLAAAFGIGSLGGLLAHISVMESLPATPSFCCITVALSARRGGG